MLECRCTNCGRDQSKAWAKELTNWFERYKYGQTQQLERDRQRLAERANELAARQKWLEENFECRLRLAEEKARAALLEKEAALKEKREAMAKASSASYEKTKYRRLINGLRSGKIDPYELLIPISKNSDDSPDDPAASIDNPVNGEFLW